MSRSRFWRTRACKTKSFLGRTTLSVERLEDRTQPASIWGPTDVPAVASANDAQAVELGVRFRSDSDGYITGLKFYKGPDNAGTHIGDLWTNSGSLLARATFTGETASGWQTVSFDNPVAVSANTTYVASYYAPAGHYAFSAGYFATSGVDKAPLHALADGVSGRDGLFRYGSGGGFPTGSMNSANYWVDVVFNTDAVDPTQPSVVPSFPSPNATGVNPSAGVKAAFNKSVVASSIVFTLRDADNNSVAASIAYDDSTHSVTLIPSAPLATRTSYTATVSAAEDVFGNELANPVSWSFTTGNPAVLGQWSQPIDWPLVAINVTLLSTGQVLMWDGGGDCIGAPSARLWDPATGTFTAVPLDTRDDTNDIFCSGMVALSDGRILV